MLRGGAGESRPPQGRPADGDGPQPRSPTEPVGVDPARSAGTGEAAPPPRPADTGGWPADAATVHVSVPPVGPDPSGAEDPPRPTHPVDDATWVPEGGPFRGADAGGGEDPPARPLFTAVPAVGWPLGPYRVRNLIGEGGMGNVYEAVHLATGAAVALKVLHRADRREALTREARAVARVDHPGVIRLYDYDEVSEESADASGGVLPLGSLYLVMELAPGGSLEAHPPATWPEVHRAVDRVLETLAAVHARGLVHRDLKPANVLRMRGGWGRGSLKLADFGLAAPSDESSDVAGTPHYMAPEQIDRARGEAGPWTDIYALGAIAWLWVTGTPAFGGTSTEAVLVAHLRRDPPPLAPREGMEVPPGLDLLLRRMLARDPHGRFDFAADARDAWRALLAGATQRPFPTARRPASTRQDPPPLQGAGLRLFALREAPLTGRAAEQEALWGALQGVFLSGKARAVVLEGAPGVGKSRLASWLVERAHEEGVARVIAATHASGGGTPDSGMRAAVARYLGVHRAQGRARVDRLVRRLSGPEAAPPDRVARVLAWLDPAEGAAPPSGLPPVVLEGPEARWRVAEEVLAHVALDRPVVLWLDDLHWGRDSVGLMEFLLNAQDSRPLPVLVVATVRAGEPGAALPHLRARPDVAWMSLPPLAAEDSLDLVRRTLDVEPDLARVVAERCEGNPLFAVRLLGSWVSEAALEPGQAGLRLRAGSRHLAVPAGIREVWERRVLSALQPLPPGAQDVLWHAAALGLHVRRDEVRAALTSPQGPGDLVLDDTWEALLSAGLLRDAGPGAASFDHGLLRETVLSGIGEHAPRVHRACAEGLSVHLDRRSPGARGRIGRHFLQAEAWPEAVDWLLAEARSRFFSFAIQEAEAALVDARTALARGGLEGDAVRQTTYLLISSRVQRQAGRCREALDLAERAWDLVADADPGLAGRAAHLAGVAAEGLRDLDRAHELGELALDKARIAGDPVLESDCLRLLGIVSAQRGDLRGAVQILRQAADLLARAGSRRDLLLHLNTLVYWAAAAGDLDDARQAVDLARTVVAGTVDPGVRALELRMEAVLARVSGDAEAALRLAAEARFGFAASGARIQELYCLDEMGEAARGVGDLDAAEGWYTEAMAGWAALGDTRGEAISRVNLALLHLARGQLEDARELAQRARESFAREGNRSYVAASDIVLAEIAAGRGDLPEAEARLAAAAVELGGTGFVHEDLAEMLEDLGTRAAASGRHGLARSALDLAARQWERLGRADRADRLREEPVPAGS